MQALLFDLFLKLPSGQFAKYHLKSMCSSPAEAQLLAVAAASIMLELIMSSERWFSELCLRSNSADLGSLLKAINLME